MASKNFDEEYFNSGSYKNYKKETDRWVPHVAQKINKIIGDKTANIMDIGCAYGYLLAELQNEYKYSVKGIDFSSYAVKESEPSVRNKVSQGDILNLPFKKNSFDVVISLDVINYLKDNEVPVAIKNLVNIAREYVFFGAIFKYSWTASQKWNPDKLRKSVLSKKEYAEIFEKNGMKLAEEFDGENGGAILVFKKHLVKK
jgi:SAM-dependent methyltransferase